MIKSTIIPHPAQDVKETLLGGRLVPLKFLLLFICQLYLNTPIFICDHRSLKYINMTRGVIKFLQRNLEKKKELARLGKLAHLGEHVWVQKR